MSERRRSTQASTHAPARGARPRGGARRAVSSRPEVTLILRARLTLARVVVGPTASHVAAAAPR